MSDEEQGFEIFNEPDGFRQSEKPFTFQDYTLQSGERVKLRLIGHNPLWGHHLWQSAIILAQFLETRASQYLRSRTVLELGAAAGLPSLIAGLKGASMVVATDYPDADLIDNLRFNIDANVPPSSDTAPRVLAQDHLWGADPQCLRAHLPEATGNAKQVGYDTLILADLLFNHSCHESLLRSVKSLLAPNDRSRALVFFTPYRPWLFDKDMDFFEKVRDDGGLEVLNLGEWSMDKVMFEADPGDEKLRKTVFGFELRWTTAKLRQF